MGWSGKVVDRGTNFLRKRSIPQHAYSDEHYQRERERLSSRTPRCLSHSLP